MFNIDDILTLMENGKTAEDIAKMMSATLNEATRIQEEKKQKEDHLAQKKLDAEDLVTALVVFIGDYYPDLDEIISGFDLSGRHIIEFLDGFVADKRTITEMKLLFGLLKDAVVQENKDTKTIKATKTLSADEADMVVGNFLKKMGL